MSAREENVKIAAWLYSLGLQQYEQAFRDNAIDAAVLPELTAEDLKDIGVSRVGHRRKLLAAIAVLRDDGRLKPAAERREVIGTTAAERRQLTVMFCDMVGSTALSARLDPEDLREVLAAYQRHVTAIVEAAGGRVARYEGDGVLAYFGYPAASEDGAVRAALELARGIDSAGGAGERLSVRVSIATGVVVVGEVLQSGVADNPPV